jgi:mannosyltransferase
MGAERLSDLEIGQWILAGSLLAAALIAFAIWRLAKGTDTYEPLAAGELRSQPPATRTERSVLATLLAVALVLRLFDLGDGLWFDEIDTLVRYARRPLTEVLTTFDTQNNHLLYSVLAHLSCAAFGESAWALRLPAVLFGVASLAALYHFALLLVDRREALFATALLTFSYHHLWFSQNARGYTALLFFTLVGSELFLRLLHAHPGSIRKPGSAAWLAIGYGACMAFAIATHVTAVLIVAAHAILWMFLALRTRHRRAQRWLPFFGFALCGCLAFAAYALVLRQFLRTLAEPSMAGQATEWKSPVWMVRETLDGLAAALPGGWIALLAGGSIVALGLGSFGRRSPVALAVMLLGPCVTAATILVQRHNLWPRFFFFGAGFAALILLRGWFELARALLGRWISLAERVAHTGAVLICAGVATSLPNAWNPKQDFQAAMEFVLAQRAPGDAVVTLEMASLPYEKLWTTGWAAVDNIDALLEIERQHPRTWIVYTTPAHLQAVQPKIWDRLEREYDVARVFYGTVRGGEVVVKVRR